MRDMDAATMRQVAFLQRLTGIYHLLRTKNLTTEDLAQSLTKVEASRQIEELKRDIAQLESSRHRK